LPDEFAGITRRVEVGFQRLELLVHTQTVDSVSPTASCKVLDLRGLPVDIFDDFVGDRCIAIKATKRFRYTRKTISRFAFAVFKRFIRRFEDVRDFLSGVRCVV